jgi:hypothetical protein
MDLPLLPQSDLKCMELAVFASASLNSTLM